MGKALYWKILRLWNGLEGLFGFLSPVCIQEIMVYTTRRGTLSQGSGIRASTTVIVHKTLCLLIESHAVSAKQPTCRPPQPLCGLPTMSLKPPALGQPVPHGTRLLKCYGRLRTQPWYVIPNKEKGLGPILLRPHLGSRLISKPER